MLNRIATGLSGVATRVRTRSLDKPSHADVIGIYRTRNAPLVRRLIEPALARGWTTAWWALDEAPDELAEITCGVGPGEKLPLLNEILARAASGEGWLVVCDDDITFKRGDIGELLAVAQRAGFGIAQPAHTPQSRYSHGITVARPLTIARATTFVESGPIYAIDPSWRSRVTPFPAERGMGWGIEHDLRRLRPEGCVLGVVDAVQIEHSRTVATEYDKEAHMQRMRAELADFGVLHWSELQVTLDRWRVWMREPPWERSHRARRP